MNDPSGRGPAGEVDRVLDGPRILEAFERLDRKLERLSLQALVHLAGSAPLLLDRSRSTLTRDVDALWIEHADRRQEFEVAVGEVSKDMGIAANWLNRDMSFIPGMPPRPDVGEWTAYGGKCLTVTAASDRQLLAMKFRAHRDQDFDDMRILAQRVGARTFGQVMEIHDSCFPHSPFSQFPDVAQEYLARTIPRILAEHGQKRSDRGQASLARKVEGAEGDCERTRSVRRCSQEDRLRPFRT